MRKLKAICLTVAMAAGQAAAQDQGHHDINPDHAVRGIADLGALQRMVMGEQTLLAVPVENGEELLDLTRFTNLTPDARIVEVGADGIERDIDLSHVVLLRGTIAGDPDSLAFVAMSDGQVNGFIQANDGTRIISSGRMDAADPITAALASELRLGDGTPFCGVNDANPAFYPAGRFFERQGKATSGLRGGAPCRVARIAVDTDYQFTANLFGNNTTNSAFYAQTLMAASSTVFERDVNVRLMVPYIRVWSTNTSPYTNVTNNNQFLDALLNTWNSSMGHIQREATHGLSGRGLGGGLAYVNALCHPTYAYGVSANLGGFFPQPIVDNSHQNWDLMVVTHELGHNFGSGHTHSYEPPIDNCGNGDCSAAYNTTVMSYCHTCPGGLSNMDMRLHPRVQDRILSFLNQVGCDLTASFEPVALDDEFQVLAGTSTDLAVLANDAASACSPVSLTITSFAGTTAEGGSVSLVSNGDVQKLRYTPPAGFEGVDAFTYTAGAAGSALVIVDVVTPRQPVNGVVTEPGVEVAYYALSNPSSMPDFGVLTPYSTGIVPAINFPSTSGVFATSGRSDNVGAVFESLLEVPTTGWYTLSVESDDGSLLYIDDDLVINNDGLHGMVERTATVPMAAGKHRLRVEFFEAGGGAGVVVRYSGEDLARQAVPSAAWSRAVGIECPADLAEPFGTLNVFDLFAFIQAYGDQDPSADIAPPFGVWNTFDLLEYLLRYNAGCP